MLKAAPFPSFVRASLEERASMAAVGRCRLLMDDNNYLAIVNKCKDQAQAADKKEKKKFMKQGVAMAEAFLINYGVDASIVNVEVVIPNQHMVDTNGCLASCWLDAGCANIVLTNDDLLKSATDAARIPRERLIVQCNVPPNTLEFLQLVAPECHTLSVKCETLEAAQDFSKRHLQTLGELKLDLVLEMAYVEKLHECTLFSEKSVCVAVALTDPTPTQLGNCFVKSMCKTDRLDGLFTTVVCTRSNEALGLVYSSQASIVAALECGRGVYYSRSRQSLWRKGDTSGHFQTLHRIDVDCDGDAVRFTVTQQSPDSAPAAFCHLKTLTCWGVPQGLRHLEQTLSERLVSAPEGSYTKRLFDDETLLRDKLVEEAQELSEAETKSDIAGELADVLYFALVKAAKHGVSIDDAVSVLDKRARKVTRRQGDSKAFRIAAGDAILNQAKST